MMASSPICLLSKATKTKSWLWHQRMSHLNFGALNHLARNGLVCGLTRLKFEKDHLYSVCAMGKRKKQSHKPKSEDTNQEKLYLLHMDLCGRMHIASINGKNLEPVLHEMTPVTPSSGLVPNPPPLEPFVPPSSKEWDLMFQPVFDKFYSPPASVASPVPVKEALAPVESTGAPSLTTVDQYTPSLKALTQSCWIKAMQEELHEFERLKVWELIPPPDKVMVITLKWIYKTRGSLDISRIGCSMNMTVYQMDVKMTFLNGILREEKRKIYPPGIMCPKFKMSMMGKILFFLGLQISQSPRGIFLNQSKYVLDSLKKYRIESCDPVDTLMVEKSKLDDDTQGKTIDPTHYRGMVGTLIYLTSSRPDLVYAVYTCARYQAQTAKEHLHAVKRIFRYLRGTVNRGLWYSKDSVIALTACADADHAGCQDTRRSTSRSMQLLGDKLVSWSLKGKKALRYLVWKPNI
uniref:Uncharacterized mitochondrial protein AtMg00810-like n=1 Tax=Tanacetum cinerariifolium TaxID=118510 RepID=A0A699GMK7_TANCI|nr:uncharacterized mitochondrial protein AtMg00810-like [Tanacetum cinerariifolium]